MARGTCPGLLAGRLEPAPAGSSSRLEPYAVAREPYGIVPLEPGRLALELGIPLRLELRSGIAGSRSGAGRFELPARAGARLEPGIAGSALED